MRPKLHEGVSEVHNKVQQTLEQRSRNNSASGVAYFPDPKMGVLTAGLENTDTETIKELREMAITSDYQDPSDLKSQELETSFFCLSASLGYGAVRLPLPGTWGGAVSFTLAGVSWCPSDIEHLIDSFQNEMKQLENTQNAYAQAVDGLTQLTEACPDPASCSVADLQSTISSLTGNQGFDVLMGAVHDTLLNVSGDNNTQASLDEIIVYYFAHAMKQKQSLMEWTVSEYGPVGVLAVGWIDGLIDEGKLNPNDIAAESFPYSNSTEMLTAVKKLYDSVSGAAYPDRLRQDLRNLMISSILTGAKLDTETYYRAQETVQLANKIRTRGNDWQIERLWWYRQGGVDAQRMETIDLIATRGDNLTAYVLIEPFLNSGDFTNHEECENPDGPRDTFWNPNCTSLEARLASAMKLASLSLAGGPEGSNVERVNQGRDPVIFIAVGKLSHLDGTNGLSTLKDRINTLISNTFAPNITVVLVVNGQVEESWGKRKESAEQLCQSLGLCPETINPDSEGSSENNQDNDDANEDASFTVTGVAVDDCDSETSTAKLCAESVEGMQR